jgi:hypothetical protein
VYAQVAAHVSPPVAEFNKVILKVSYNRAAGRSTTSALPTTTSRRPPRPSNGDTKRRRRGGGDAGRSARSTVCTLRDQTAYQRRPSCGHSWVAPLTWSMEASVMGRPRFSDCMHARAPQGLTKKIHIGLSKVIKNISFARLLALSLDLTFLSHEIVPWPS